MATQPWTLIERLEDDHRTIERMLTMIESKSLAGLGEYFCALREALVRHEVAEELIVYPQFRRTGPEADEVANLRISEQAEAEQVLARLEKEESGTEGFRQQLLELRRAVLDHAAAEEREVFPVMKSHLPAEQLRSLGERYARVLGLAPTHPHPHAPDTPPGNMVLGPIAALVDRFRDAMRGAA